MTISRNYRPPILITGGAGYIGSHLALMLRENGYPVTVYDDLSTGHAAFVPERELIVGDILDTGSLAAAMKENGIETVVHLAAKSNVPESFDKPNLYFETNVEGTISVIRACAEGGVKQVVFSSTAAVYGDATHGLVNESAPLKPISPYGESKLEAEKALNALCLKHEIRQIIFRYFNVIGAHPEGFIGQINPDSGHLLQSCLTAARNHTAVNIFGTDYDTSDGSPERDFIHVQDLASLQMQAIEYLGRGGESMLLNAGYGKSCSVLKFVDTFKQITGYNIEIRYCRRRPGDPPSLIADVSRLRRTLKWQPCHDSIKQMIRSSWQWDNSAAKEALS